MWAILVRELYRDNRQYNSAQELLNDAIFESWAKVPNQTIVKLVESMPKRIFEVIKRNGCAINY